MWNWYRLKQAQRQRLGLPVSPLAALDAHTGPPSRYARWWAAFWAVPVCTNLAHVRLRCLQCHYVVYECACHGVVTVETSVLCRRCAGVLLPVAFSVITATAKVSAHRDMTQLARLHQRIVDRAARLPGSPERRAAGFDQGMGMETGEQ